MDIKSFLMDSPANSSKCKHLQSVYSFDNDASYNNYDNGRPERKSRRGKLSLSLDFRI